MKKTDPTERQANMTRLVRAAKEISELPKNAEWRTDGAYVTQLLAQIISICERTGTIPTIPYLCTALGITKDTENEVRSGAVPASPEVVMALTQYYSICENVLTQSTLDGTVNNIGGIFMLKSGFGYREEPKQVIITHNKLIGERKDPDAIAQRYASAMVIDGQWEDANDESGSSGTDSEEQEA